MCVGMIFKECAIVIAISLERNEKYYTEKIRKSNQFIHRKFTAYKSEGEIETLVFLIFH
jgi:hypothetical protein